MYGWRHALRQRDAQHRLAPGRDPGGAPVGQAAPSRRVERHPPAPGRALPRPAARHWSSSRRATASSICSSFASRERATRCKAHLAERRRRHRRALPAAGAPADAVRRVRDGPGALPVTERLAERDAEPADLSPSCPKPTSTTSPTGARVQRESWSVSNMRSWRAARSATGGTRACASVALAVLEQRARRPPRTAHPGRRLRHRRHDRRAAALRRGRRRRPGLGSARAGPRPRAEASWPARRSSSCRFAPATFDVATSFEVVYHLGVGSDMLGAARDPPRAEAGRTVPAARAGPRLAARRARSAGPHPPSLLARRSRREARPGGLRRRALELGQ